MKQTALFLYLILPSIFVLSCEKPAQEAPEEAVIPAPEALPPADWAAEYGLEGSGEVAVIGDMFVARKADGPGPAEDSDLNWEEAMDYAADLDWLGRTDWRLPTDDELREIFRNVQVLEDYQKERHWSSSEHPNVPERAASVIDFADGRKRYWNKQGRFKLRVVRSMQ